MSDLNAREAADALGVHYQTVRKWIRTGALRAVKVAHEWRVPLAEIERIRKAREDSGETAAAAAAAAGLFAEWHSSQLDDARSALAAEIRRLATLADNPAALASELDALRKALDRLDALERMGAARDALHRLAVMYDRVADSTGGWVGDANDPGPRIRGKESRA